MLALVIALAGAGGARAAARFDYRGLVLPERTAESMARTALQSPGDSVALSAALGRIVTGLEDMGYLDARASGSWSDSDPRILHLEVSEGARYRIAAVSLRAVQESDSTELRRGLGIAAGDWASPRAVAEAIERSLRTVTDQGYPYAAIGVAGWDLDSSGVQLSLSGSLGPRVTVSEVRFEGLKVTRSRIAEKSVGRIVGLPYNPAAAEAARQRLAQLGLFRSVELAGLEGDVDPSRARLVFRVEEPRYNRFEGAFGVQGEGGTVGLAKVELGNLLGTGRAMGLDWESRGRGVTRFGAHYAEPLLLGAPLRLEAALEQQVQGREFIRTRWGGRLRWALTSEERVEAGFDGERVVQEQREVSEADLQTTVLAVERSALDHPLFARRGVRLRIAASQTFKQEHLRPSGKRDARASAAEVSGEWHRPLGAASGVTLELQSAGRFSSQRVLSFYERYPLGGAASLRGYDEEAFRVDRFALTRLEWRRFMGAQGQRVFLFWDHAWAATRETLPEGGDRFHMLNRDGFGFGLRLEAAGALAGLDYGLAPGRGPLEGRIHVRLLSTF